MRRVILESPFAGNLWRRWRNRRYARACMADSLRRGEAPYASHLLYTQPGILRDGVPAERQRGINAGFAWLAGAAASVVYVDRGISNGMRAGIAAAMRAGVAIEFRALCWPALSPATRAFISDFRRGQVAAVCCDETASVVCGNCPRRLLELRDALACTDDHCRRAMPAHDPHAAAAAKTRREHAGSSL